MKKANQPSALTAESVGMHLADEYRDEQNEATLVYMIEKNDLP